MNAAVVMEAENTPEIKNLRRKKQEAERKLLLFQSNLEETESRLEKAKARRLANLDADKAGEFLIAERQAETNRDAASEPLRVCKANIGDLQKQINEATGAWKQQEKERVLEDLRTFNASTDEQMIALQKSRVEKVNSSLGRLHELDREFAGVLVHGNPDFYLNGDVLVGRRLPSVEIGPKRVEFKWIELPIAIKN